MAMVMLLEAENRRTDSVALIAASLREPHARVVAIELLRALHLSLLIRRDFGWRADAHGNPRGKARRIQLEARLQQRGNLHVCAPWWMAVLHAVRGSLLARFLHGTK